MSRQLRGRLAAAAVALSLTVPTFVAMPAHAESETASNEFFDGFVSWLVTIPYGGFKTGFGLLGGLAGGFTWAFAGADVEAGRKVWDPSLGGNWVVEPEIIRGKRDLEFVGKSPAEAGAYWMGPVSLLGTIPYGGVKSGFGMFGGIIGAFTWIGSGGNSEVAANVWDPSLRGDYVIPKDVIRGDRGLEFIGKSPGAR